MNNSSIYPISLFTDSIAAMFYRVTLFYGIYLLGTSVGAGGFSFELILISIPSLFTSWGLITYALLLALLTSLIKTDSPKTVYAIIACTFIIASFDSWRVIQILSSKF